MKVMTKKDIYFALAGIPKNKYKLNKLIKGKLYQIICNDMVIYQSIKSALRPYFYSSGYTSEKPYSISIINKATS